MAQIGSSSIFMYDERYGPRGDPSAGLYRTRLMLSLAWIIGPPLSYLLFWALGFEVVTLAVCVLIAGSASAMFIVSRVKDPLPPVEKPAQSKGDGRTNALGFWPIFVVMVATTCANVLHSMNMPLYLVETVGVASYWPGLVMATAAGIEVVVIGLLPRLTKAASSEAVLRSGLLLGILYFALLNVVTDPGMILMLQLIYGAHFAATTVVCLPLLRQAIKGGTGSLAAQFNNAGRIGGLAASALFAILVTSVGYHGIITTLCPMLLMVALAFGIVRWTVLRQRANV
jgi:SET family sugar efflux transporter-like MFS transporter